MKTKPFVRFILPTLGCLALLGLPAYANPSGAPQDRDSNTPALSANQASSQAIGTKLSRSDHKLLRKASVCSAYETAISQQATTRATNAQVRTFAQDLARDHERISRDLDSLAARRGALFPVENKHADDVADLAKKTGNDYDEAYLEDIIDSHEDAIKLLEKASKSKDAEVAAFATTYLPVIRDHLAKAKQLEKLVD